MKSFLTTICLVATLVWTAPRVFALSSDFEIHCVPKKVSEETKKTVEVGRMGKSANGQPSMLTGGGMNNTQENWTYEITIENKAFKPAADLQVKYTIYFAQEQLGVKANAAPHSQDGTFSIPALGSRGKETFTTDPVLLKKSSIAGNYYYPNGAKPNAQDTLVGVVVRIFQNGQQLAEYANPSTLLKEQPH